MSLAMPADATRTVVCAVAGEAASPRPAMSAITMPCAIGSSSPDVTFVTVWYVGAQVNVDTEVSMRALMIGLMALVVGASAAIAADSGRPYPHHRRAGPPAWCNQ